MADDGTAPGTRLAKRKARGGVREALPHDSAVKHVAGEALYTDDLPELPGTLHARVVMSARAHARLTGIETAAAAAMPGVHAVITAADVPGEIDIGPVFPGDPVLADGLVEYVGQAVAAVAAETPAQAIAAAKAVTIGYDDLPAILTAREALEKRSFVVAAADLRPRRRGGGGRRGGPAPGRGTGDRRPGPFLPGRPDRLRPAAGGRRPAGPLPPPSTRRRCRPDRQGAGESRITR